MKNWKELLLVILLLLGAFIVRLYHFNGPLADWHSWRQADTSAVSRNFIKHRFDLLHPRIDNISNVQTDGRYENPQGYFFAEFPLYNAAQAGLFVLFHHFTIEEWGRLVSIFSSLVVMVFLYFLAKRHAGKTVGMFALFFYAFLPFSIYYSRTILPQSSMLASLLAGVYFFDSALFSLQKKTIRYLFGIISLLGVAAALLMSPYAVFYSPTFLYLLWKKWKGYFLLHWQIYPFAILAILPLWLWRTWMLQYPEGIPSNLWLLNAGNIRFTGAFFYWIFADRFGRLILGYYATALFLLGLVVKRKHWGFFASFFLGTLLYVTVIARGNVQHDYYQLVAIPSICLLLGSGAAFLYNPPKEFLKVWISRGILFVAIAFSLSFSWYFVRDFFNINNPDMVVAGQAVDKLTPKNAKILTFYNGDSTFLYQTNRQGWASLEKDLNDMIIMGADYIVIADPTKSDLNGFGKDYRVVGETPQYLIIDLHHKQ